MHAAPLWTQRRGTLDQPTGRARGEQLLRRIETMLDESIVQKLCRIRMHATERVESKRNEDKVLLVTAILVRLDVVVVEQLKGRQGTGLSPSPVIDTQRIGRITDGHVQNVRLPALIGDVEVRPFAGRDAMLIIIPKREFVKKGRHALLV